MTFKNVYVGGTLCKNAYVGTQRVWTQATLLTFTPASFPTNNGATEWIYINVKESNPPTGLTQHPERIKEVRLSTGLILPHVSAAMHSTQIFFMIRLADTLANLGVPLDTRVTIEIDYWSL